MSQVRNDSDMEIRTLIIDDNPADRKLYQLFLEDISDAQYVFFEAGDVANGLDICKREVPDCILLDYMLPELNGLEFVAELTRGEEKIPIPVVMLTGYGSEQVAVNALKSGVQDYLIKAEVTADRLHATIKKSIANTLKQKQLKAEQVELEMRQAEVVRKQKELSESIITDELTKVYNNRYCWQRTVEEVSRAKRYGLPLSMLFIDIDDLKHVNAVYGYEDGDAVLAEFALVIKNDLRTIDIIGRFHDEEFIVVLPCTALSGAYMLATRICNKISQHKFVSKNYDEFQVTCSIGVVEYDNDLKNADALFEFSSVAMYFAKEKGCNQVRAWPYLEQEGDVLLVAGKRL